MIGQLFWVSAHDWRKPQPLAMIGQLFGVSPCNWSTISATSNDWLTVLGVSEQLEDSSGPTDSLLVLHSQVHIELNSALGFCVPEQNGILLLARYFGLKP